MKRIVLGSLLLVVAPAWAQEQKFVPFTIDQQTYNGMMNYLGEIPAKYANPMITTLIQKEQEALKAEADKAAAPKKD